MGTDEDGIVRFCRSRSAGRRCTRPLGHAGLHRHRTIMWTDAGADAARCPRSGAAAAPVATLDDGFPQGRAPCPECHRFIDIEHGTFAEHETSDAAESEEHRARAREWFNRFGW